MNFFFKIWLDSSKMVSSNYNENMNGDNSYLYIVIQGYVFFNYMHFIPLGCRVGMQRCTTFLPLKLTYLYLMLDFQSDFMSLFV